MLAPWLVFWPQHIDTTSEEDALSGLKGRHGTHREFRCMQGQFRQRDPAPDAFFAFKQARCGSVACDDDARGHRCFRPLQQHQWIQHSSGQLKAVIGNDCHAKICGRHRQNLANQLIGVFEHGIRFSTKRTALMLFRIQVDKMQQREVRLELADDVHRGQRTAAIIHPLGSKRWILPAHLGHQIARRTLFCDCIDVHCPAVAAFEVFGQVEVDVGVGGDGPGDGRSLATRLAHTLPQSSGFEQCGCPVIVAALCRRALIVEDAMHLGSNAGDD